MDDKVIALNRYMLENLYISDLRRNLPPPASLGAISAIILGAEMGLRDVSTASLKSHIADMLGELAELAEQSQSSTLAEIALRLRLLAGDPALRTSERDFEEVLLTCQDAGLQLIKSTRFSGPLQLMPTFRLECGDTCPDELCCEELADEKSAVAAFMRAQNKLRIRH